MVRTKFKHPSELRKVVPKEPVSARISIKALKILKDAANTHEVTLSEMLSNVIEDYANWLASEESKKK